MNSAPQGWYVDPSTGTNLRFWSGSTWTDEVAPLPHKPAHSGPIDLFGGTAIVTTITEDQAQSDEPAPSDSPVPVPAEDGSQEGELDPDLEHTLLTRRELRARRGRESAPDDTPKHLPMNAPPAAVPTESRVEEIEIPELAAPDEVQPVEAQPVEAQPVDPQVPGKAQPVESEVPAEPEEPESDPGRTRRIVRMSVLLGVLAVVSSVAVLTAGTL